MNKKFYLIYQCVLIIITIVAIGFGIHYITNAKGATIVGNNLLYEMTISIILLAIVLVGYIGLIAISRIFGEKIG